MKLIIILLCLGLQRYLNINVSLADYDWFKPYTDIIKKSAEKLLNGYVGVAVVALPVVVVVWLIHAALGGVAYGILGLVISVVVLFYCMDGHDLTDNLKTYLGMSQEGDADKEVSDFLGGNVPEGAAEKVRAITDVTFTKSLHNVFSVLFWYLILGTFGALLYFMVSLINKNADKEFPAMKEANALVLGVLDWIPVRLLGLSMALVGSFGSVFGRWMKALTAGLERSNEFATEFGLAAIGKDPAKVDDADVQENKDALAIVFRALIVWVVFVALLTIVAFLG